MIAPPGQYALSVLINVLFTVVALLLVFYYWRLVQVNPTNTAYRTWMWVWIAFAIVWVVFTFIEVF